MEWVSNAKRFQHENEGTIFTLKHEKAVVKVHKLAGCGDKLYLSCNELGITQFGLNTEDFDIAVKNTKEVVKARLEMLNEKYSAFLSDNTGNEIVRY